MSDAEPFVLQAPESAPIHQPAAEPFQPQNRKPKRSTRTDLLASRELIEDGLWPDPKTHSIESIEQDPFVQRLIADGFVASDDQRYERSARLALGLKRLIQRDNKSWKKLAILVFLSRGWNLRDKTEVERVPRKTNAQLAETLSSISERVFSVAEVSKLFSVGSLFSNYPDLYLEIGDREIAYYLSLLPGFKGGWNWGVNRDEAFEEFRIELSWAQCLRKLARLPDEMRLQLKAGSDGPAFSSLKPEYLEGIREDWREQLCATNRIVIDLRAPNRNEVREVVQLIRSDGKLGAPLAGNEGEDSGESGDAEGDALPLGASDEVSPPARYKDWPELLLQMADALPSSIREKSELRAALLDISERLRAAVDALQKVSHAKPVNEGATATFA